MSTTTSPPATAWWTVPQLSERYHLSRRCIYHAIACGKLVAHRFGIGQGAIRIAEADRLEWERRCRNEKAARDPAPTPARLATAALVKKHLRIA